MAINPIQSAIAGPSPSLNFAPQFSSNVSAGDLLIVEFWIGYVTGVFPSVTLSDDAGNSYSPIVDTIVDSVVSGNSIFAAIYAATANSSSRPTVTVQFNGSATVVLAGVGIYEYPPPVGATNGFDTGVQLSDNGTVGSCSGGGTTSHPHEVVIALGVGEQGSFSGTGWTSRNTWSSGSFSADGQDQTALTSSTSFSATETATDCSVLLIAAFRISTAIAISFSAVVVPSGASRAVFQSDARVAALPIAASSRAGRFATQSPAVQNRLPSSTSLRSGKVATAVRSASSAAVSYLRNAVFNPQGLLSGFRGSRSASGTKSHAASPLPAAGSAPRLLSRAHAGEMSPEIGTPHKAYAPGLLGLIASLAGSISRGSSSAMQVFMATLSQDAAVSTRLAMRSGGGVLSPESGGKSQAVGQSRQAVIDPPAASAARTAGRGLSAAVQSVSGFMTRMKVQPIAFAGWIRGFAGRAAETPGKSISPTLAPASTSSMRLGSRSTSATQAPVSPVLRKGWVGRLAGHVQGWFGRVSSFVFNLPGGTRLVVPLLQRSFVATAYPTGIPVPLLTRSYLGRENLMLYLTKHPLSTEDFNIDLTALAGVQVITSISVTPPSGLTIVDQHAVLPMATLRIGGGTAGVGYLISILATLNTGEVKVQNLTLTVALTAAAVNATQVPVEKDPQSNEKFQLLWADMLGSDTIVSSSWQVSPPVPVTNPSFDGTSASAWLGTSAPGRYPLTNTVTTLGGQVKACDLYLIVAPQ